MTPRRIVELDAWRGIAACVVFFHHLFINFPAPFEALRLRYDWLYQTAYFISELNVEAVLLFFVVSGFSIHLSSHGMDMRRPSDVNAYIYKRLKRLLPLYYLALAFTIFIGFVIGADSTGYSLWELVGNILFLQSPEAARGTWFVPFGGNYPLWSLSFEMFFYICYIPLIRNLRSQCESGRTSLVRGVSIALGFSIFGFVSYNLFPNPLSLFASHFIIWYSGVILAAAYLGHVEARLGLAVIAALTFGAFFSNVIFDSAILGVIGIGLFIALVWMAFMSAPGWLRSKVLRVIKPIVLVFAPLGFSSYAIYLFHYPLIDLFSHLQVGQATSLLLVPVVCVLLAISSEYLLSIPKYRCLMRRYVRA